MQRQLGTRTITLNPKTLTLSRKSESVFENLDDTIKIRGKMLLTVEQCEKS